jgi:hypothetical protein
MHQNHFFLVKVRPFEGLFARKAMARRHSKHLSGFNDEFVIQFGEGYGRTQKADIELAGIQSGQLLGGRQGEQRELHTGELHAEAAKDGREPGIGDRGDYANAQIAHEPVFGFFGPPFSLGGGGKDCASFLEEHPASLGEVNGAGGSFQQFYTQLIFQAFDLGTQGGLSDVERFGRAPETQ